MAIFKKVSSFLTTLEIYGKIMRLFNNKTIFKQITLIHNIKK